MLPWSVTEEGMINPIGFPGPAAGAAVSDVAVSARGEFYLKVLCHHCFPLGLFDEAILGETRPPGPMQFSDDVMLTA